MSFANQTNDGTYPPQEQPAALPPARSEPLFGTLGWTADDLKMIALSKCIDLYKSGIDSECLREAGPAIESLWAIGRDACTPHVPNAEHQARVLPSPECSGSALNGGAK
jgi:hypothetical protein